MKALFLVQSLTGAGSRYRVLQYLPYLKAQGVDATALEMPKGTRARWSAFKSLGEYDVVLVQKRLLGPLTLRQLRRQARRLVYDLDDAVMFRDSTRGATKSWTRGRRFAAMAKAADLVIAGNDYLAELAREHARQVVVIPTAVDVSAYPTKRERPAGGQVTLGWIGGGSTLPYLEQISPALEALGERHANVRLKIVCNRFLDLRRMPVEKKVWRLEDEVPDLQSFDIGVMPLADDAWTRGKCGFKILQYGASFVPTVCSPVGANCQIVTDGVSGYWARTTDEWVDRLERLIGNLALRDTFGRAGRARVEAEYSTAVNGPRLLAALARVARGD